MAESGSEYKQSGSRVLVLNLENSWIHVLINIWISFYYTSSTLLKFLKYVSIITYDALKWVNKSSAIVSRTGKLRPREGSQLQPRSSQYPTEARSLTSLWHVQLLTFQCIAGRVLLCKLVSLIHVQIPLKFSQQRSLNWQFISGFPPSRWYPWSPSQRRFHGDWDVLALRAQPLLFTEARTDFQKDRRPCWLLLDGLSFSFSD